MVFKRWYGKQQYGTANAMIADTVTGSSGSSNDNRCILYDIAEQTDSDAYCN